MAGSVNKVILVGRLGADPEVRYTPNGQAVASLRVATSEWIGGGASERPREERTEWHRVVVWGKLAEQCKEYLAKGRQLYLEGRIQTRQWEDKDGQKRYSTEVVANTVVFLGTPPAGDSHRGEGGQQTEPTRQVRVDEPAGEPKAPEDDDFPF